MTSNVGSDLIKKDSGEPLLDGAGRSKVARRPLPADEGQGADGAEERLRARVPEPDRQHHHLPFALARRHPQGIVNNELRKVEKPATDEKGIRMEVTDAGKDWLGEKGYDPIFEAPPVAPRHPGQHRGRCCSATSAGRCRKCRCRGRRPRDRPGPQHAAPSGSQAFRPHEIQRGHTAPSACAFSGMDWKSGGAALALVSAMATAAVATP